MHLTKRGGHAAAGGFSLTETTWAAFVTAFGALSRPFPGGVVGAVERGGRLAVDLVLPASYLGWSLADELDRLAPYGPGHVEPLLAVTGLQVVEARRVGSDADHVLLRLRRGVEVFDGIAFATPADRPLPEPGSAVDLVARLERDLYQGIPRLRLRVLDYADAAASPLAARRLAPVTMAPAAAAAGSPA